VYFRVKDTQACRPLQEKKRDPYRSLRARLLHHGLNLKSFARMHSYAYTTVHSAARGLRGGVKSVKIRKHLEEVANAPTQ